ncbi:MAG: hypothetical protein ACOCXH_11535 [Cyclobacteriaceae bacterium]
MRKTIQLLIIIMISTTFMSLMISCDKDDDPGTDMLPPAAPTINVTSANNFNANGAVEIQSRQLINFEVEITAPAIFKVLNLSATLDGAPADLPIDTEYTPSDVTLNEDETLAELTIDLPTNESLVGEWLFTFEAEDKEGQKTNEEVTVLVTSRPLKVNKFTGIILETPDQEGNAKTFYSTSTNKRWSMAEILNTSGANAADIDFGFYFDSDESNNIFSAPSAYPIEFGQAEWNQRNETRINLSNLTDQDFDNIDPASSESISIIEEAFKKSSNDFLQQKLIDGDVLSFETDPKKGEGSFTGLIKIIRIAEDDLPFETEIDVLILAPEE